MRPALKVLVTTVLAVAVVAWLFGAWRRVSLQAEARFARERLKREFLERSAGARGIAPEQASDWRAEVRALAHWYADEVQALKNRYPEGLGAGAPESARGAKDPDKEGTRAEWQHYAAERFKLFAEGRYEPVGCAADRGMHLDLLSVEPAPNPAGGGRALRVEFALWGAPRRTEREMGPGGRSATVHVVLPYAFKELRVSVLDAQGKTYAEMSGPGEPYQKLADPERFVEEFPPGVLFGAFYLDALPREATRMVLTLPVEAHGLAGTTTVASFRFDLPVADSWKLPPGEAFQAETREAPR